MDTINHNKPDNSGGQSPGDDENLTQVNSDDGRVCFYPLAPDLDSTTPGNTKLFNAQILLLGSDAISFILTGAPKPESFSKDDLIQAGRWLWWFYALTQGARTKEEFTDALNFLLKD